VARGIRGRSADGGPKREYADHDCRHVVLHAGARRAVVAVDGATGAAKWSWELNEGDRAAHAPRRDSGRGVAYWSSGADSRIFTVTPGFQLAALDANTGKPIASFGKDGVVDLKAQLGVPVDLINAAIGNSSPPLVAADTVVIGPALEVGLAPPSMKNVPGRILAIDARTGALKWRFNTIPVKGEPGYDTGRTARRNTRATPARGRRSRSMSARLPVSAD
jgi:quinoprotein glucose dehydrogenase